MAPGMDYAQIYKQAEKAYIQRNYEEAAAIIDRMAEEFPDDPSVLLLRGHVYCYGLQQYEFAKQQYKSVLQLTEQPDLVNFADKGLEQIRQWENQLGGSTGTSIETQQLTEAQVSPGRSSSASAQAQDSFEDPTSFNSSAEVAENISTEMLDAFTDNPFTETDLLAEEATDEAFADEPTNPFGSQDRANNLAWQDLAEQSSDLRNAGHSQAPPFQGGVPSDFPPFEAGADEDRTFYLNDPMSSVDNANEDPTFVVSSELQEMLSTSLAEEDDSLSDAQGFGSQSRDTGTARTSFVGSEVYSEQEDLVGDFDFQDELENLSDIDITDISQSLPESSLANPLASSNEHLSADYSLETGSSDNKVSAGVLNFVGMTEGFGETPLILAEQLVKPTVEVEQGPLAPLFNASLTTKGLITAGVSGVVSAIAVGITSLTVLAPTAGNQSLGALLSKTGLLALVGGVASSGTALVVGQLATSNLKRSTKDLQTQFNAVIHNNFDARATVHSEDELGQLAAAFNQMTRSILTATKEAQRRAEETEQAREDLQRQVIRLLDDVEGAARGDLTVQAEVTADVLGAVADAFNLTIQNLRGIVHQVEQAAQQVNKGSKDSEHYARSQAEDARHMAEELAVTLNSVQMMTESIQRVAENAHEAEKVAQSSSVTALKGGQAVERTVAGILQIRETVSETARKVKRLAEASQEISKIVALISQLSSRTNLLALNASIQAARAGEAGRGFAVVADEVRQLADRGAKSLKEIEQIVLQIQSETGSVMTAMEEGIQQVIDVTNRAEQAKKSLEDIIQVSNHIDGLVRMITADTAEQRENSRAVAQVMQSVELTAQETSHESQRVAGSLQNLVGISEGLLSSVKRFRVVSSDH